MWQITEPLLGLNAIKIEQFGAHPYRAFLAVAFLVSVAQRVVVKFRAYEKIAQLAEGGVSAPEIDPLVALSDSKATISTVVSTLDTISHGEVAADDLLKNWKYKNEGVAILNLLRSLGLISIRAISQRLTVRANSDIATDFLTSMARHLEEDAPFIGAFDDAETNINERYRLRELIRRMEQSRVNWAKFKRRPAAKVARHAKSSLIIIKAIVGGETCILMQWSESWGRRDGDGRTSSNSGYYWFIGGLMEPKDEGNLIKCAVREVSEELGVDAGDVQLIEQPLFMCTDRRVSRRVGLYTEFEYYVFAATLRLSPAVPQFVQPEWTRALSIHSASGEATIPRQMRWRTWMEIKNDPLLQEDASVIVSELEKHLGAVPLQPHA
ncbi:NUDIX domain-containing protein [Sorangium sp. So ce321]|uniref:NUDIX hydrolase n=1 Tax=Sorangium sp. So ce321 TaxID=3133300 RepID=UPI003F5DF4F8